ncbi:MAG: YihY/virulence factor BrkB family protein [Lachnospiraceae bacterium]|nr:YihY/virulence factor BrkB family protein [Lachnospiraceae bacterium]
MKKAAKKLFDIINAFSIRMRNNHVDIYTASASYFIFISIIPFILALLAFIPITPLSEADLLNVLDLILPDDLHGLSASLINELYGMHVPILSISIVFAIWTSSRGLMSIRRGLDEIVGILEPPRYMIIRVKSVLYTLVMIVIMIGLLLIGAFGKSVIEFITPYLPQIDFNLKPIFDYSYIWFLIVAFMFFIMLYSFLPHEKQKIYTQIPGALISSAGWLVVSKGFSFYVSHSSTLTMYGSLATVIIFLIWIYIVMYIMFFGAQANKFLLDYGIRRNAVKKKRRRAFLNNKSNDSEGGEYYEGNDPEAEKPV